MNRDAAAVEIGIEKAQPVGRALHFIQRGGARQQQNLFGHLRGRDPDLLAVDDIFVAGPRRAGLQLCGIETGIGLGDGKAGPFRTRDDPRQHAPALLWRAEHHHRIEPEYIHVDRRSTRHAGARFCNRPHHDRGIQDAEPGAAIGFRNADAEPAGICQRLVEVGGVTALLVLFQPISVVETRADLADGITNRFLVGGEREIHLCDPLKRRGRLWSRRPAPSPRPRRWRSRPHAGFRRRAR